MNAASADHRKYEKALKSLRSLESQGFQAMLAGGCVRDRLLNKVPKDYDIATNARPEEVTELFKSLGFKVIPTGIDHGTVTVVIQGDAIEITTLRKDVETDGRRAVVTFSQSFEEDSLRRDFTINAMYMDGEGQVHDFHDGLRDLRNGHLRFVGNPVERIREDYLRILRLFRFWARLSFTPDQAALDAVQSLCSGIAHLSQERVTSELIAILEEEGLHLALPTMANTGVLSQVLPEGQDWHSLDFEKVLFTSALPRPWRAMAALASLMLCTQFADNVAEVALRLKLSKEQQRCFTAFFNLESYLHPIAADAASAMERIDSLENLGGEGFFTSVWHSFASMHANQDQQVNLQKLFQVEKNFRALRLTALPIDGHTVMEATGLKPGLPLGQLMRTLLREFRNQVWRSKKEGLASAVKHATALK